MDNSEKEKIGKLTKEGLSTGFRVLNLYLIKYKKDLIVLSVIGILSAIGNGVAPYIIGRFFDSIIEPASVTLFGIILPLFAVLLSAWFVIQLITYLLDWRLDLKSDYLGVHVWADYVSRAYSSLLSLPISFHKEHKSGKIGSKINQTANALETLLGQVVIDLSPKLLSILIACSIALYVKPNLAVILIVGLTIYLFALIRKFKPLGILQKEQIDKIGSAFGSAYDAIGNVLAVKQASAEKHESKKIESEFQTILFPFLSIRKIWASLTLLQRFIILIIQVTIFSFSVFYIFLGQMTVGDLLIFNAYTSMIFGPFTTIVRSWRSIHNGIVNIQETEKILGLEPENYDSKQSLTLEIKGEVEFKNVSFFYESGKPVLKNISFSVNPGEVAALVGESGVGKSTLVDLVSAYNFASEGEIKIDGHDIKKINLRNLRSQIAVVPQEVILFNDTIKTNIAYGSFNATDKEITEAARKAHALEFIEKFPEKWDQIVGERGIKLSVGQKQRVAIARAILRNPKILILDEPTSALDAGSEKIINESLEELMRGKTTFIIAHRLSTVRKANKIFVFKDGVIIESGTHHELLKIDGGEYRRLYELQIGLHK